MDINNCNSCDKYTVSCRVLEGFECCRCCGIGDCEYDICPPEEKLLIRSTKTELLYSGELSSLLFETYKLKDSFFDNNFHKRDYLKFLGIKQRITETRDDILNNKDIRPYIKEDMLKDIKSALSSYKDVRKLLYNLVKGTSKGGNFRYYRRNLHKFKAETIAETKKLNREERYKLLKLKGIDKPFKLIP